MLWIQSYLMEVGRYLPARERDDILQELGSSLTEQAQDLAGDRAPTPAQEQQVIDRMGHPLKVASSFDRPRYLIGPELFPTFMQVLRTVLLVVGVIQCALILSVYVTTGWTTSPFGLFRGVLETLIYAGCIVAIVFVTAEYFGEKLNYYDDWSATSLNPNAGAPISRGDLITNLVSEGVFLLWWNGAVTLQNWIPGTEDALFITLSEAWAPLYLPLNILFGAWFILHAVVFIRGLWRPLTLWLEIALGLAGVLVAGYLVLHSPLVTATGNLDAESMIITQRIVFTTIIVIAGFIIWDVLLAAKRLRGATASHALQPS